MLSRFPHFSICAGFFFTLSHPNIVTLLSAACPPNFHSKHGHCLHESTNEVRWCEAQDQCRKIAGELVTGSSVLDLLGNYTEFHFIGLTDMLDETRSIPEMSKRMYRWTNGLYAPRSVFLRKLPFHAECKVQSPCAPLCTKPCFQHLMHAYPPSLDDEIILYK